ncbi:hypothetical protein [Bartonella sp. HY761]|uniref:hypothetical protein n=1 Tax=Bartonella sp. HY761 TaxID=2979330 RepID=UPI002207FAD9|nr:hypothetical protein [Bartonella sp. HY761]UXN07543.1 hypothetical protein N6A79_06035 [Bartonella sp. HY761]
MVKRRDTMTYDLFRDYQPEDVAAKIAPEFTKGGTLNVKIARVVAHACEQSGKSREAIASEMSAFLDQKVTLNMLDAYASPARETHKITVERFIALLEVTQCYGLLAFLCQFAGYVAVPERYGDIIEIWREDREIEERQRRRDALMGKVRSLK